MAAGPPDRPGRGERELIAELFAPLAGKGEGAARLTDDAAYVRPPPGCDLVVTQDALVGGGHFRPQDPAGLVARKALRVNLSDLAAKGGTPIGYLLCLGLTPELTGAWAEDFAAGLAEDQARYGIALLGGDTVRVAGAPVITVTVLGTVPTGTMVRRAGAEPGDIVFVSGTIGDGALGLGVLEGGEGAGGLPPEARSHLERRYLLPEPRVELAEAVRGHASAAMDVSDGLVGDLGLLLEASGCAARIDVAAVPLSPAAAGLIERAPALLETALTGGDDYEILCTVPPARAGSFAAAAALAGVPVARIGVIAAGPARATFVGRDGRPMAFSHRSFTHF